MPYLWDHNFFKTIRYFNRYIGLQAHEPVYLLRRMWAGPWRSGTPSSYTYQSETDTYEFSLYTPTDPASGGKPRLRSLKMTLNGTAMIPVPALQYCTSNLDFWVEIDKDGPTYKGGETYGRQIIGFNPGFNPTGSIITYEYEEVCWCIDDIETSFHPNSRCTTCYGTGFVGGYSQYTISEEWEGTILLKPANMILCRFPITTEAVRINRYGGEIITQRKSWAIANPVLRDWDILIRTRSKGAPINIDAEALTLANERYFIADIEYSTARPSYDLAQTAQLDFSAEAKGITMHQKFSSVEIQPEHISYAIPYTATVPGRFTISDPS